MNGGQRRDDQQRTQGHQQQSPVNEIVGDMKKILDLGQDKDGSLLIKRAEELGKHLASKKMSTTQIRAIFSEVKKYKFEEKGRRGLNMLRYKLAYVAGRHQEARDLQMVLDKGIELVNNEEQFDCLKNFFEAVVAYHKKYGGKE